MTLEARAHYVGEGMVRQQEQEVGQSLFIHIQAGKSRKWGKAMIHQTPPSARYLKELLYKCWHNLSPKHYQLRDQMFKT